MGTRRVGHSGTLDPIANGLLVVAVGPATRFLQFLPLEPKEYVATFEFGRATTTYDAEGETVSESAPPNDLRAAILEHRPEFLGLIKQVPPMHSAIKLNGKPLYTYARKGEEVEREPRRVHIGEFEILEIDGVTAKIRIECSGGTYVRSLGHDLGQSMGCGATMVALTRTRVGRFWLNGAVSLESASPTDLVPLREALQPVAMVMLNEKQVVAIRTGQTVLISDPPPDGANVALLDPDGNVFSMARVQGNVVQPDCVIPEGVPLGVD